MKRIFLFLATNLAVILVMSIVLSLLGVNRYLYGTGLNLGNLLVFSLVVGFTGSIISLLISKPMAKWSTGARVITTPANSTENWLLSTVGKLSREAGINMPEVAVYDGEPNAFATGAFKNSALVAVSTGLLQGMNHEEIEAVLGHEIAHVANGDMVTLTLIQGVLQYVRGFPGACCRFFCRQSALTQFGFKRRLRTRLFCDGHHLRNSVWGSGVDYRCLVLTLS